MDKRAGFPHLRAADKMRTVFCHDVRSTITREDFANDISIR